MTSNLESATASARSSSTTAPAQTKDAFIERLQREQTENGIVGLFDDTMLSDERRVVFVDLVGLMHSWRSTPTSILSSALFILPLKQKWIYSPSSLSDRLGIGDSDRRELCALMALLK